MENNENTAQKSNDKKKSILIVVLLLIALIAVGVTVWALCFRDSGTVLSPDYAPQQEEQYAEDIGRDESKLEVPEGGGAVGLSYSTEVKNDHSEEKATLLFQNPARSNGDMVVQIVIQDEIVAQSGKLVPGKQITALQLLDGAAKKLQPGVYDAKFVVLMYDEQSGEKAMINSEGAISVTVVE